MDRRIIRLKTASTIYTTQNEAIKEITHDFYYQLDAFCYTVHMEDGNTQVLIPYHAVQEITTEETPHD